MLLNQSLSNSPASTSAWHDVVRVCRRICILRERGQGEEAERLRTTELADLIAARTAAGDEREVATRLEAIFAAEEERVANAAVVAELLLPLLTQELRAGFPLSLGRGSATAAVHSEGSHVGASAPPQAQAPTDIAGFIDQMIAQDDDVFRRAS